MLVSSNLTTELLETKHSHCERSDHHYVVSIFKVRDDEKGRTNTVGYGNAWKLHPNNCNDFHFRYEASRWAEIVLELPDFKNKLFTPDRWEEFKIQLQRHAKEHSYKFGYLNKRPDKQIKLLRSEIKLLEARTEDI